MSDLDQQEQDVLDQLAHRYLDALRRVREGDVDGAEDALRDILCVEPRLPEPHLSLARLLLDTGRVGDAEPHAREALRHLEASGPWTDDLPEDTVLSVAAATLAEILRQQADEDDVIFGDPEGWRALVDESRALFARAAALDPTDTTSSYYAVFMGPKDGSVQLLPGAGARDDAQEDPHEDGASPDGDEADDADET